MQVELNPFKQLGNKTNRILMLRLILHQLNMSFTFRLDVSIHLNYLCLFQVVRGNSIILLEALDRIGWSVKVGGVNGQQWRMDFNFIDKDVWERICVWYCVHVWQDAVWGRNMLLYTCRLKSFNSFWLYVTFSFSY